MKMFRWGPIALGLAVAGGVVIGALGLEAVAAQQPPPGESGEPRMERPAREKVREGMANRRPGVAKAGKDVFGAAAEVIGIERSELGTELKAGKSLTQIASENGVARDKLKSDLFTKLSSQLTQAVADGKITEEQKTTRLNGLNERMDQIIDSTHEGSPDGAPGSGTDGHRDHMGPRGGAQTP